MTENACFSRLLWFPNLSRLLLATLNYGVLRTGLRPRRQAMRWPTARRYLIDVDIFLAGVRCTMPLQVAAILAHELVHAAVGIDEGHGKGFRRVAKGIGLTGKMTATVPGPVFESTIKPILKEAGPLPHGQLKTGALKDPEEGEPKNTSPKKQTKRHIKCRCNQCGYVARTSRKWLQIGAPLCPARHGELDIIEDESQEPSDD